MSTAPEPQAETPRSDEPTVYEYDTVRYVFPFWIDAVGMEVWSREIAFANQTRELEHPHEH